MIHTSRYEDYQIPQPKLCSISHLRGLNKKGIKALQFEKPNPAPIGHDTALLTILWGMPTKGFLSRQSWPVGLQKVRVEVYRISIIYSLWWIYCLRLFADWRRIHFEQNQFKYHTFPYVIASSVIFHYFVKFHNKQQIDYKGKGNAPPGIQDVKVFYMPSMLLIDIPHKCDNAMIDPT